MKRSFLVMALTSALIVALALPLAAATNVSKRVGDEDGTPVILVRVDASDYTVFGIDIDGGAIENVKAPKGWVAITNGDHTIFRTKGAPVRSGSTLTFRIYSSKTDASLNVSVRDNKNKVRTTRSI